MIPLTTLSVLLRVRPPIGKALAADAFQRSMRSLGIAESSLLPLAINLYLGFAVVIAEVKFCGITAKVLRADMVKRADNAALENREISFNRVCVCVAAHVFSRTMIDRFMALEHRREDAVLAFAVGHQIGIGSIHLRLKDWAQIVCVDRWQMERAHLAAALDKRENHLLADSADMLFVAFAAVLVRLFAADVGFICLHRGAVPAKLAGIRRFHAFADAVRHEPGRLVGHAKHTLKLFAADTFLARAHQVSGIQPFVQRDMAALIDRANHYREVFAAIVALMKAGAMAFTLKARDVLGRAAVWANRAIGPADRLKVFAGFGFIGEDRIFHDVVLSPCIMA